MYVSFNKQALGDNLIKDMGKKVKGKLNAKVTNRKENNVEYESWYI